MHLEIVHEAPNGLSRETWRFWLYAERVRLILDDYQAQARASRRHAWRTETFYTRTDSRRSILSLADVPLPPDVIEEARQQLISQLTVGEWGAP